MRPLPVLLAIGVLASACEKQPASIKVKLPRDSIQSTKTEPQLPPFTRKGDTIKLRASSFDAKDVYMGPAVVKWTSSDPTVATVNGDGLVTILSSGEATIKATSTGYEKTLEDGFKVTAVIIGSVKIVPPEPGADKIHLGETKKFTAEVLDDRGNPIQGAKVRWRTSDYAATVTGDGEVEGRAMGDTQLVVEADSKTARFQIVVLDWKK